LKARRQVDDDEDAVVACIESQQELTSINFREYGKDGATGREHDEEAQAQADGPTAAW
jgi:hypothetical protein